MNIIEKTKEILTGYEKISEFSHCVHVDYTAPNPTNYGLSSTGDRLIKEDILGNELRQHNFVLYAVNQSFNDFDRLANSTFLLDLNYWLESQKGHEVTVTVNGVVYQAVITKLWSANGMMYSVPSGDMNDGVSYQLQIYAQYKVRKV
ncbi:MAG: hypothetical protein J6B85_06000 [Lachnospiraceae bacterium]|nr:hypothetical protein [Lachnospiraceae bacterium]